MPQEGENKRAIYTVDLYFLQEIIAYIANELLRRATTFMIRCNIFQFSLKIRT